MGGPRCPPREKRSWLRHATHPLPDGRGTVPTRRTAPFSRGSVRRSRLSNNAKNRSFQSRLRQAVATRRQRISAPSRSRLRNKTRLRQVVTARLRGGRVSGG